MASPTIWVKFPNTLWLSPSGDFKTRHEMLSYWKNTGFSLRATRWLNDQNHPKEDKVRVLWMQQNGCG